MGTEEQLLQLMRMYAQKGVEDWCAGRSAKARRDEERALGSAIAANTYDVSQIVSPGRSRRTKFIPMPRIGASQIEWAFFCPWREAADECNSWAFDLFLSLPKGRHIGFRFEPADVLKDARHGYSHVQLSWRFGHRTVTPANPLKWLPDSYPAFPVPGKGSLERFLMMVVSMHGFPGGTRKLLQDIDPGRPVRVREYTDRVGELLSGNGHGS